MHQTKGKVGFTARNFDLLHPGYIYTFEAAKENCDYFMVFLQRDPSETRFTKYTPVIPLYERYKTLMAVEYIDEVITYQTEEDLLKLMEFYKPDVRILGDDYIGKRFTGDHLPIDVVYTTRAHGWSTTKLKDLITIQTVKQNPDLIDRAVNAEDNTPAQKLLHAIRESIAQHSDGEVSEEEFKAQVIKLLQLDNV